MKASIHEHLWHAADKADPLPLAVIQAVCSSSFVATPKASAHLKADVLKRLTQNGWAGEVEIDSASAISITSIKERTGLCFQTGNVARMYADLLKLQAIFARKVIDRGVLVIPTLACARVLGSNIANFERLKRELEIFAQVITMPLLLVGIE